MCSLFVSFSFQRRIIDDSVGERDRKKRVKTDLNMLIYLKMEKNGNPIHWIPIIISLLYTNQFIIHRRHKPQKKNANNNFVVIWKHPKKENQMYRYYTRTQNLFCINTEIFALGAKVITFLYWNNSTTNALWNKTRKMCALQQIVDFRLKLFSRIFHSSFWFETKKKKKNKTQIISNRKKYQWESTMSILFLLCLWILFFVQCEALMK